MRNGKVYFALMVLFMIISACRKENLETEYTFLTGKWKTVTTNCITHSWPPKLLRCDTYEYPEHYLEFRPDGSFITSNYDGSIIDNGRIIKITNVDTNYQDYEFNIKLKSENNSIQIDKSASAKIDSNRRITTLNVSDSSFIDRYAIFLYLPVLKFLEKPLDSTNFYILYEKVL